MTFIHANRRVKAIKNEKEINLIRINLQKYIRTNVLTLIPCIKILKKNLKKKKSFSNMIKIFKNQTQI
jgi:hypothetical protein